MDPYLRLLLAGLQALAAEFGRRAAQWTARRYFGESVGSADPAKPDVQMSAERAVSGLAAELRELREREDRGS